MSQPAGLAGVAALAWAPRKSPRFWLAAGLLAVAAAAIPGIWSLAGLLAFSVALSILIWPEVAVYLLTLSVPLASLLEIEIGKVAVPSTTEVLAGLLALGWCARSLARRRLDIPLTPLTVPLALMLAAVAISAYQATDLSLAVKELLKWLELVLVYLFVVSEMSAPRKLVPLLLAMLAGGIVEALIGSAQFVLGMGPDSFAIGRFMRSYGTFDQPNPYAGYLGMLIPLAVGLLLSRPAPRVRYYTLAAFLLCVAAVGMSLSRGAWVGIALGLAAMALFWSRRSRLLLALGALASLPFVALAFLNLLPVEISGRLATALDYFRFVDARQEVVTAENWAVIERVAHWQAGLDMIEQHPLFGVGAGNYPAVYPNYMLPGWLDALGHAHNYYLNVAAEMGIPAALVYLSVIGTALVSAARWLTRPVLLGVGGGGARGSAPRTGDGRRDGGAGKGPEADGDRGGDLLWRGILLGVLGSLLVSSIHNMFDSLFVHGMSIELGMVFALAQVSAGHLFSDKNARPTGA